MMWFGCIIVKRMFKKQEESLAETETEVVVQQLGNGQTKRYQKGRVLGKGGFAECYEFISQETGRRYAAKVIAKQTLAKGKAKEKLQSEILIHKSLRHHHIVKFEHFFQDHQNVYILLELCSNNTLNQLLKRRKILTELQVKFYMIQIIRAVKYIHSRRIIHRDLKLGNFFLTEGLQVKVGDFGLATTLSYEGQRRKTICGTPNYIAPEILQGKKGHSYEVDVWSLGVIAFALLFGKPPFETNQVKTTYQKIKVCDYTFPKTVVSSSAKNFIAKMLKLHPADRSTIQQLLADDFLSRKEIPRTLPLSTLACPPSKAFLEQIKNDQRPPSESKISLSDEFDGLNTSRTDRQDKFQCLLAQERFDSIRNHKSRKSERSTGSITRAVSTAAILTRKKVSSNMGEQKNDNKVWVSHFEEHAKYGVFYLMSNGAVGMRFNDITCLITTHNFKKFKYIELRNGLQQGEVEIFEVGQERESLTKKMKIINHFYRELKGKGDVVSRQKAKEGQLGVYVRSHFVTRNYTLFWLSNSNFHAKFYDNTCILAEQDHFTYIDKNKIETINRNDCISIANQEIKYKFNHVTNLIQKIKKKKIIHLENKDIKEIRERPTNKENHSRMASSSSNKLIKPKTVMVHQFASTTNLKQKNPLADYNFNL